MILGVTGGIGAGKSAVLDLFQSEFGAEIIRTDEVAAALEEPGQPGLDRLTACFGKKILGTDGHLDRKAFARRIFSDPEALRQVNGILHPLTWQAVKDRVAKSTSELVVIESALFDESSRELCQKLICVDTSEENRIHRLMESRGYTREKCLDIMKNQPGREQFLQLADVVLDNNGSMDSVREQIASMLKNIQTEEQMQ